MRFLAKTEKNLCIYSVVSISLALLFLCKFSQDISGYMSGNASHPAEERLRE